MSVAIDGAGTQEMGLLKMDFASGFSASGFALIIGYLQAAYLRSKHTASAHGGKPACTTLEEPEKPAQAELCMGPACCQSAESGPDTHFTAGEEITTTSPNSPYLLLSLFLSVITQIAPTPLPPLFFPRGVNKHFL